MFQNPAEPETRDVLRYPGGVAELTAVRFRYVLLAAWLRQREADAVAYLMAENRTLRAQLGRQRLRLTDAQRRRLADEIPRKRPTDGGALIGQ